MRIVDRLQPMNQELEVFGDREEEILVEVVPRGKDSIVESLRT